MKVDSSGVPGMTLPINHSGFTALFLKDGSRCEAGLDNYHSCNGRAGRQGNEVFLNYHLVYESIRKSHRTH